MNITNFSKYTNLEIIMLLSVAIGGNGSLICFQFDYLIR